ncbi:MAG: UvrD-helicase domain-containing protein [Eubacteriales bacterium]|nr:UvrD-helicase domain-containing protein [Eubacteriales bacterium]
MDFTPAQADAIHARNRELLVSAAAGSGKTRVLIERIFSLIREDGLSVDRMLIVTFTHAAAGEMRERLQARIAEAATGDVRMRRQAELLETAQISTLHSFCQKLTREYFQVVNIDPQSALGDEAICANLRSRAKAEALDWLYEQAAAGDAETAAFSAKFEQTQIDRMLDELYPFLMAIPDPFGWLERWSQKIYEASDLENGELAETLLSDCRALVSGISDLAAQSVTLGEYPRCPEAYLATIRMDAQAAEALGSALAGGLTDVTKAARAFSLSRLPSVRNLEGEEAEIRDRYKANRDQMKKLAAAVGDRLPEDTALATERLNAMQPSLRALARLARVMDERYAAHKRERNLLDYSDLERMALTILQVPAIREEVAARFDGLFVDEYQDISGIQEAVLNALKRDVSRETSGPPQRVFYVGDVKQSIYRFRQADPTLFMRKAHDFSPQSDAPQRRISLNANFRSREAVLAGVNRVFERVMRADVTEIDYDAEARLYPGLPSAGDPPVSLHLFTQPAKGAERAKLQAYAIGREILRRVGRPTANRDGNASTPLKYRDIAILGPKMKDVSEILERTLSEMGIPVYCEDRGSAMESEEIAQALIHLRLMDHIADDLALLAWLRGPAMGMDERELAAIRLRTPGGSYLEAVRAAAAGRDALSARCTAALETLEQERFLLSETPLDQYLWGWLNRSGLYAFYGCQPAGKLRQANLRMLCQKAGEHALRRGGDVHDFLESVQARAGVHDSASPTVLSPWEDVVRVMTIHKSKGLEFPVVFVMGLEESFARRHTSLLSMHPRLGVALPYVNEETRTTSDTLLKGAIDMRSQAEEKAERARLLYVAMTRARDKLVLLGCDDGLSAEAFARRQEHVGTGSAYEVFSASDMLGWVCQCVDDGDLLETWADDAVSDMGMRTTDAEAKFSTHVTSFPQKTVKWRVVFHNDTGEREAALRLARGEAALSALDSRKARLETLLENARLAADALKLDAESIPVQATEGMEAAADAGTGEVADPVAPRLSFAHHPFKVGVTALAQAEREQTRVQVALFDPDEGDAAQAESAESKRLPLLLARPRLMDDLPSQPAFLRPPMEQTGVRRGVATHKALSLLHYALLRPVADDSDVLNTEIANQLQSFCDQRLMTQEEYALTDAGMLARFLQSAWGRQALAAQTVRREWNFNLRLPERDGLIVQGVIDLCYLKDGQWSLVDYKTDRVETAEALWTLYGEQIALYRRALAEATATPVREATLFSLTLGVGATR